MALSSGVPQQYQYQGLGNMQVLQEASMNATATKETIEQLEIGNRQVHSQKCLHLTSSYTQHIVTYISRQLSSDFDPFSSPVLHGSG